MSDLLPLVVEALKDKVAVEAQQEITKLKEELSVAHSVEIIRSIDNGEGEREDEDVVVYASASFLDGRYGNNPNLWTIPFKKKKKPGSATCRLANLRDCQICVGGGFPVASLDDEMPSRPSMEGWFQPSSTTTGNDAVIDFCFCPNSTWLGIAVKNWPREAWEAVINADNLDPENIVQFLVETVAVAFPEATVEFLHVSFVERTLHGAMKRLLPPKRRAELQALRDSDREDNRAYSDMTHHVATILRAAGNTDGAALFIPQLSEIVDILFDLDIVEVNERTENVIDSIIAVYTEVGREGLEARLPQLLENDEDIEDESC